MDDDTPGDASDSGEERVGLRVTSDPDRTEIEQPDTAEAREVPSLPFRLLLVSDLTPASSPDDWSDGTHVYRVDPNSFAQFMEERAPRLSFEVRNTLGDAPETWDVELAFSTLDAFEPEALARQIEPTAQLLSVRDLVQDVGEGTIDLETFGDRLDQMGIEMDWADELYQTLSGAADAEEPDASTGAGTGGGDESLDRLMGMVDAGDAEPEPSESSAPGARNGDGGASDAVDALMDAVTGDDPGSPVNASAVEVLVERLNGLLREQVQRVVDHPEVRRLESAWRGLKFLVDRLNFRERVELVVLPVGRDDLHEALHHQVLVPEHSAEHDDPPVSLVLVDEAFGRDHRDIEQLEDLAGTGESLQTPVVASVAPSFFGMERLGGLRKLPALRPHLQGDEYVEWESLRSEDASAFLGLTVPSFLVRGPYDGSRDGVLGTEDNGLLGGGALAVGVAAAESFVDTGWPTHLQDVQVDTLPVTPGPGGTTPLATLLSGSMQSQLARAGFVVLGGKANRDSVRVTHASMVHDPGTFDDPDAAAEARAEASLPCQLFVARAAHQLLEIEADLDFDQSLTAIREEVAAAMASFLNVPVPEEASEEDMDAEVGEQPVSVEHVTNVELPNQEVVAVRLRPPDSILAPNVRLAMALRVPVGS